MGYAVLWSEMSLDKDDINRLIRIALEKGWSIGYHRHPKTRANWDKR